MNEPSWFAASVSGYIVVDVNVLVPFGSIAWEAVCVGCNSTMRGPRSPGKTSDLSEKMESKEVTGLFERFGETMSRCSSPLQETMRFAMRLR